MKAFGQPGVTPNWSSAKKMGVGTALEGHSRVWFTLADGIVTEIYYPTVDQANVKDFQFLVVEAQRGLFLEEKKAEHHVEYVDQSHFAPAYRIVSTDRDRYYQLVKTVITSPESDAMIVRVDFSPLQEGDFHLYALLAPHLENCDCPNSAYLRNYRGRSMLLARGRRTFLALAFSAPLLRASCGYVGFSDGWQDLKAHRRMEWSFDEAPEGNVALTAEIDLSSGSTFTAALAFSATEEGAMHIAQSTLNRGFERLLQKYVASWNRYLEKLDPVMEGREAKISAAVIRCHMDKSFPGGIVASLSIPWGESAFGSNIGGYHLVWPRDLCKAALGLLAVGDREGAEQTLNYLSTIQKEDGGWPQNCWLDGRPYWGGVQLDETAYPILLAYHLVRPESGEGEELYGRMIRKAALYLTRNGPVTPQDRWEEDGGYSPSTLAICIAALTVASLFAKGARDWRGARYFQEVADYWWSQVDAWTYTTTGKLLPGKPEYYERINAVYPGDEQTEGDPNKGFVPIKNLPPDFQSLYPKYNIIDGGFLDLVRLGLKRPDDPHILNSIEVYDALLKTETEFGPVWHRYNHDGYGEQEDGSPYRGVGRGRGWPLLTGERGHWEVAAGRSARPFLEFMERCAGECGLIPEQVWDAEAIPEKDLYPGRPTGSARPLVWAHAEYLMLYRAEKTRQILERLEPVYRRYVLGSPQVDLVIWKRNHKVKRVPHSYRLRIEHERPGEIAWSCDGWRTETTHPLQDYGWGEYYFEFAADSFTPNTQLEFRLPGDEGAPPATYSILIE
ncbi:glycoside hydrolase family 15 protein [Desulfothermobacter acidiphilus]|uniref:glycoside hydrolase family 15 protein n=1 Tax=Desulfothermobacter acidiphilus TaxID=1938353 RepID=UPI003F8CA202